MNALIIGCGWVGTIFAKELHRLNYEVHGTTTSAEKAYRMASVGMISYVLDFSQEHPPLDHILTSINFDLILVSVPAKKIETYTSCSAKFERLSTFLQTLKSNCVIYLSSVGIYPALNKIIHEYTVPADQLDTKLYHAEFILSSKLEKLNILRLGGIFGADRIPGKHFSGKVCKVGNQPANYIHVDDICNILLTLRKQEIQREILNAVSPSHPLKAAIISAMVAKYGFSPPIAFEDTEAEEQKKIVSSEKLIKRLNYTFLYKSPTDY
ncbi:Rossmann-fold NAD(P)-binding domain-containing protein [Olivibacter domesticus]|uniref:Nucleoside-diphosphate-sugar epimerase n=1 Tax=Olivibacter domesticus TaxID=407022 RepID=A0A1H7M897_OLID1|nr:hypothetical protein [Olivibacter domesticus]SEL06955.1 Nucleoside-diphosphate-sugar epimerase [Olivibacter domesticus]